METQWTVGPALDRVGDNVGDQAAPGNPTQAGDVGRERLERRLFASRRNSQGWMPTLTCSLDAKLRKVLDVRFLESSIANGLSPLNRPVVVALRRSECGVGDED